MKKNIHNIAPKDMKPGDVVLYAQDGNYGVEREEPEPQLPKVYGSGVFWNEGDYVGTRVALRTGSYNGKFWHYLPPGNKSTIEISDAELLALIGKHKFTVVEPRA